MPRQTRYVRNGDTSRIYSLCTSWAQLTSLYDQLGLADRHMEEVILECTPHKFYLDVERALTPPHSVAPDECLRDLEQVRRIFEDLFLAYLLEFVQTELGIAGATRQDLVVSYSSKPAVKFSAHIVLTTPGGHYFKDRRASHAATALMARFMHDKAENNALFKSWYYVDLKWTTLSTAKARGTCA